MVESYSEYLQVHISLNQTLHCCVMVSELCDCQWVNVCGGNQPREIRILWMQQRRTQHELCMLSKLHRQINQPLYGSTS